MNKTVLVVAAHTDDEAIGCGGTIAKHVAAGDEVHALFLADGVTSREASTKQSMIKREVAAKKAQQILGISSSTCLGLPDNRLDTVALLDIVQSIEKQIQRRQPQVIYTHHYGDLNIDHRITHQAVITACRPQPGSSVREIYAFEVMSSTEWATPDLTPFMPNTFIDITKYWHKKKEALERYVCEMRMEPHSRSISHLDVLTQHRGMSVGMERAEAFYLVRKVECEV
ncbi:MAG: PIG-L family deacetylase [Zetaproteobacteria bacterium]|nr:PIG-L family deacetylase [Zetaproteobacteria bacterium]